MTNEIDEILNNNADTIKNFYKKYKNDLGDIDKEIEMLDFYKNVLQVKHDNKSEYNDADGIKNFALKINELLKLREDGNELKGILIDSNKSLGNFVDSDYDLGSGDTTMSNTYKAVEEYLESLKLKKSENKDNNIFEPKEYSKTSLPTNYASSWEITGELGKYIVLQFDNTAVLGGSKSKKYAKKNRRSTSKKNSGGRKSNHRR